MTEEIAAVPGWAEERLDEAFAAIQASPEVLAAKAAYLTCLAGQKAPAAPSDTLGAEFELCRPALHRALLAAGIDHEDWGLLAAALEVLEAEVAGGS